MNYIDVDNVGDVILTEFLIEIFSKFSELIGIKIPFGQIEENNGICFSPDSGSKVLSEKEDILGNRIQQCTYPFFIVYRCASELEFHKLGVARFLDMIGDFLVGQEIEVLGERYRLKYPKNLKNRKIKKIVRDNYFPQTPREDGVQDWILPVHIEYENYIEG